MSHRSFSFTSFLVSVVALAGAACLLSSVAVAQKLQLKDGRVLSGKIARTAGVAESLEAPSPQAGEVAVQPIYVIEDDLRRVFISNQQAVRLLDQAPEQQVKINLWQNAAHGGAAIASVGPSLGITPFDEFGRRIYKMQTRQGPLAVVQGITELTPRYARVEGLLGQPRPIVWDSRIATSSIPIGTIANIFRNAIPQDDVQARLQVVRFYIDGERFSDATRELKQILAEFPEEKKSLESMVGQLRQKTASVYLRELELRKQAGQHALVHHALKDFPADEVAGETLQQVRELIAEYDAAEQKIDSTKQSLQSMVEAMTDPDDRGIAAPLIAEVIAELSQNNIDRLVPYIQLSDDPSLSAEEKTALALSGWLLGPDDAITKLPVAISLVKIRASVLQYLNEPLQHVRLTLLDNIRSMEGASIENVAKLLARIKPPSHEPVFVSDPFGEFRVTAPGQTEDGDFHYTVQLPPEYDPHRRYPTILALNGAYNSPDQELDFWAGSPRLDEAGQIVEPRRGQAMRRGYITISVDWLKPQQYHYEYSAREHIAVLTCLRDACRRFHIDADRVYLSGHGVGGDAAWDLGQSHPDLWAGVVPFVAEIDRYGKNYWENARYVPFYFVEGELDGQNMKNNAPLFDRYLRLRFDATVVEYLGRGQEPFHDEIQHLFEWMNRRTRQPAPEEFECATLRPWDNFFWWIECHEFPEKWMVHPAAWKGTKVRATAVEGKQRAGNRLLAKTAAEKATFWLRPDVVDFSQPIRITINGSDVDGPDEGIRPELDVLLEDARTRADRLRPFWAKVEWP